MQTNHDTTCPVNSPDLQCNYSNHDFDACQCSAFCRDKEYRVIAGGGALRSFASRTQAAQYAEDVKASSHANIVQIYVQRRDDCGEWRNFTHIGAPNGGVEYQHDTIRAACVVVTPTGFELRTTTKTPTYSGWFVNSRYDSIEFTTKDEAIQAGRNCCPIYHGTSGPVLQLSRVQIDGCNQWHSIG